MLSLTRRIGESTYLINEKGEEVLMTVGSIKGNQVKLHFSAPESITILRSEIKER